MSSLSGRYGRRLRHRPPGGGTPPPPNGDISPPGNAPRIWLTPDRLTKLRAWTNPASSGHPWWLEIKAIADLTNGNHYNDYGQWASIAYLITGDSKYVTQAVNLFSNYFRIPWIPTWGRNETRELFIEAVAFWDMLYPGFTTDQRQWFLQTLIHWGDLCMNQSYTWNTSYTLSLVSWGDGSGVPTSGSSSIVAGLDTGGSLHVRIFDPAGVWVDIYEQTVSSVLHLKVADSSGTVRQDVVNPTSIYGDTQWFNPTATFKSQIPSLLPPHVLSGAERTSVLASLRTFTVNDWGTGVGDSDETVGHYMGMVLLDLATQPDSQRPSGTYINGAIASNNWPVGGFDVTEYNPLTVHEVQGSTIRNDIARFIGVAEGGEWIESGGDYNSGTVQLLTIGVEAIRTLTGVDYFPEVTAWYPQLIADMIHQCTSDLTSSYIWGDNDLANVRDFMPTKRLNMFALLSGAGPETVYSKYARKFVDDMVTMHGYSTIDYGGRLPYLFDPDGDRLDWRDYEPKCHYAPGMGIIYFRDGWDVDGSLFGAQMTTTTMVQHQDRYFGDFQLYRGHEWAVTHVMNYGGIDGEFANVMLIAGLSSMAQHRGPVAQGSGTNGEYAYIAGSTWGNFYIPSDNAGPMPPVFLHEWTRSIFYLPSPDRSSDVIVVFDRTDADDPEALPTGITRYRGGGTFKTDGYPYNERIRITETYLFNDNLTASVPLKQWIIHSPVSPTLNTGSFTWNTAGNPTSQAVRVDHILPASVTRTVINEFTDLWPNLGTEPNQLNRVAQDTEKKYQTRIVPSVEQQWDVFLNVISVRNASVSGTNITSALVQSTSGAEVSGAMIGRSGLPDTLVLFSAEPYAGNRVLARSFTVGWTAVGSSTVVYQMDLASDRPWTYSVDSGQEQSLTISSAGVASLTVSGSGSHTIGFFQTSPPIAPSGLQVIAAATVARLTWVDNSDNETGFYIERRTGTGSWSQVGDVATGVTRFNDSGMDNNTAYGWRVRAYNTNGTSAYTSEVTATTTASGQSLTFTDSFNRANGALGTPWTVTPTDKVLIDTNTVRSDVVQYSGIYPKATFVADAIDYAVQVKVASFTTGTCQFGMSVSEHVALRVSNANIWTTTVLFGGTELLAPIYFTLAPGDIIRAEQQGTSLTIKVNNVVVGNATITPGTPTVGIAFSEWDNKTTRLDDFTVEAIS